MQEPPWTGLRIRQDWLDELGVDVPTTIDEMHQVLVAFKDKYNAKAPLTWWDSWMDSYGLLIGAWDIGTEFYRVNNVVKYGPIEDAYKDYITTLRSWYEEGLLDKEFTTRNGDGRQTLISNNQCGVYVSADDAAIDEVTVAVPYLTLDKGDIRHYNLTNYYNKGNEACITSACKYPEAAVKWFDYHYSDNGYMLFNYGIEGTSYNMVDEKPQFTELMTNNPDGYSATDVSWVYKIHVGPYNRDFMAYPGMNEQCKTELEVWGESTDGSYVLPPITLNADEGQEFSEIMSEIDTFVDEMSIKFIMGIEPMDKYDKFISQIKKMNIERAIEIQQSALDRYNNR